MGKKDPPPDELRCKRTDGRQWRCKRLAVDGRTLCDIHHLQGKHRQHKQKVPDALKLQRSVGKKRVNRDGETSRRVLKKAKMQLGGAEKRRRRGVSEALDKALKRMKLKRGDLQLELIRVFLKRQVEKKKDKELKENAVEETRELPYGVMAISQSSSSMKKFCENSGLDVKVGADSTGNLFLQRHFRSKNIEPLPISTVKVVPFAENLKKKKIKKCHFCRETKHGCLIKCMACKKRFFCVQCIKERHFNKQEVKVRCPACCGTCSCKLCVKQPVRAYNHEGCYRDGMKLDRKHLLHYLIYMLLPVLKKVNLDHTLELEKESRITGEEQSGIRIHQTKLGFLTSEFCNRCKSSIVDYHRTCSNCSYNLCLSCCRKISENSSPNNLKLRRYKKRRTRSSGDEPIVRENIVRDISHRPICLPGMLQNWTTTENGCIPCPPADIGGCGESALSLRYMLPFNWTRDLEVRAEEILCSYHFPESTDVSSCCVLCKEIVATNSGDKLQRKLSRRIGSDDSYLYCPTLKDLHLEKLEHFQSHWGKGHPVIVRNVLRSTSGLCWDPVIMLCSYMESKCSESCKRTGAKSTNCLDWCEVEIGRRRIFMGSLEKRTHASVRQKFLKFKAWLSSHLFRKQFPVHYNEIVGALPLPEYVHPFSGLLNVGLKFPENLSKPDLGPSVFLSFGGPEELNQSEYLSKLSYESHDTVNILVHATDAAISPDQISKVQSLTKKYMAQDNHHVQSSRYSSNRKGKSSLQSDDTGESSLREIGGRIKLPKGVKNIPFYSSTDKCLARDVESGNPSDESESDAEESILCFGSIDKSEESNEHFQDEDIDSSISSEDKGQDKSCGAQWDIFSHRDVPKLQEYLRRHSNELSSTCNHSKLVHPILDENFFLDAYHKLKLKEEFDVQPWTFEQHTGEAILIPAGCPFQIKKVKSCVNVVLDFISPENASRCAQLNDEIRLLPSWHKAKNKTMEVEKMALQGISAAIEDICNLLPELVTTHRIDEDKIEAVTACRQTALGHRELYGILYCIVLIDMHLEKARTREMLLHVAAVS